MLRIDISEEGIVAGGRTEFGIGNRALLAGQGIGDRLRFGTGVEPVAIEGDEQRAPLYARHRSVE